ncbi:GyrI-like domain-containing protein [Geothrix limicola]|nr:GyrI-like domain-containing protein [Geothrix limicola]
MSPKLTNVSPFSVTGISVRTINRDEFNPTTAKLPNLWARFYGNGVTGQVPNQAPGSSVFGVYSDYESDATGFYSVTAGMATSGPTSSEFTTVSIEEGRYLVFENRGPMPQAVIDTWGIIWAYFENNTEFIRSYTTDFEEYRGPDQIAIHIGVRG